MTPNHTPTTHTRLARLAKRLARLSGMGISDRTLAAHSGVSLAAIRSLHTEPEWERAYAEGVVEKERIVAGWTGAPESDPQPAPGGDGGTDPQAPSSPGCPFFEHGYLGAL